MSRTVCPIVSSIALVSAEPIAALQRRPRGLTELLRARLPDVPAVVLSDRDNVEEADFALRHGVRGYIPTSVDSEIAVAALRLISAGGTFVPADALRSSTARQARTAESEQGVRSDEVDLTPRELSVVDLLRMGKL